MARIVNLISIFFVLLCSGQLWGFVVTQEDNIYRYDGTQIATDSNYGDKLQITVTVY